MMYKMHLAKTRLSLLPVSGLWFAVSCLVLVLDPQILVAQPVFTENYYIVPNSDVDDELFERCVSSFGGVLTQTGRFMERNTPEVSSIVSGCLGDVASPSFQRECNLAEANSVVDLIISLSAQHEDNTWFFDARVVNPNESATIWRGSTIVREQTSEFLAAHMGCEELAQDFIGDYAPDIELESSPIPNRPVDPNTMTSAIEVLRVVPAPAELMVDGVQVGILPGQIQITPGEHDLEIRVAGYIPWTDTINLRDGEMFSLNNLILDPIPATIIISSSVAGATILVDGREMGSTSLGTTTSISVDPDAQRIEIRREGYESYEAPLHLIPGATQSIIVELTLPTDSLHAGLPSGFVFLRGGTFSMGSSARESGRYDDETQHQVTLGHDIYVQRHEVTQEEWQSLMGDNPSRFANCGPDCPVENVNWWEALEYANTLSSSRGLSPCYTLSGCRRSRGSGMSCSGVQINASGNNPYECEGMRLPTESEWEYAYRSGTTSTTYAGTIGVSGREHDPVLASIGWYGANAENSTQPVGQLDPNLSGLYDMSGNVWEWCWDWYGNYVTYPQHNPLGATGRRDSRRVVRGGAWDSPARANRAANRYNLAPNDARRTVGFRLVQTVQ